MARLLHIFPLLLSAGLFLSACTANRVELGSAEHTNILQTDRHNAADRSTPEALSLSYNEALKRAIAQNLDARVSALEALSKEDDVDLASLQALPDISLSATAFGRSNEGASSSRSIISGNQSLEPSYSTERYHNTREMSVNWNTLDLVLAVAESRIAQDEAMIARQRHAKVLQNIERDVHSAYWRAYAFQQTADETGALLSRAKEQLANVHKAHDEGFIAASAAADLRGDIHQQKAALDAVNNDLSYSQIELKSLLSIPQGTEITLTSKPDNQNRLAQSLIDSDLPTLEEEALFNRPEINETILQKNIDAQNTRNTILRTMPGADLFFASNRDSNDFLYDEDWLSFSASISQSLSSLFTLPARHRAAQNIEELGEARRLSLTAAIMTQVHLARHRLDLALQNYEEAEGSYRIAGEQARKADAQKSLGLGSGNATMPAALQAQTLKIKSLQAHAEMQEALASLLNTLGRPLHGVQRGQA